MIFNFLLIHSIPIKNRFDFKQNNLIKLQQIHQHRLMITQEQSEGFKMHSETEQGLTDDSKSSLQQLAFADQKLKLTLQKPLECKVRHVYLEQQNSYGRFVPFLLLKDKLQGDLDNSGHTVLHHMCSHNSDYIPLYLSVIQKDDPILNMKSKLGHSPLDVAGIYCDKLYVNMLIEKGAKDQGNVDHWAIQGGNLYNWTGHVDISKKYLIHWAAYNNMPEVLKEFYRQGANLQQKDANNFTPTDLAVINKSYQSFKVLTSLGFRPKQKLVKQSFSKSINKIYNEAIESQSHKKTKKYLKLCFIPMFFLLSWLLMSPFKQKQNWFGLNYLPLVLAVIIWIGLIGLKVEPQAKYANTRYSGFYSDIIGGQVNKNSHLFYLFLNIAIVMVGLIALLQCETKNYIIATMYCLELFITIVYLINTSTVLYGIIKNLTHEQMFNSWQCKYLWKKVRYIEQKKMLIRNFSNPLDRGVKQNLKRYFTRNSD